MGNEIIVSSAGVPFADEGSAKRAMKAKGLDPTTHTVIPHEGGFGIAKAGPMEAHAAKAAETASSDEAVLPEDLASFKEPANEKYFRCVLPPKRDKNDENFILGSVNGESYNFQREVEIVVPGRFIAAWKLTTRKVYSKDPGSRERTLVGRVSYCTPTVLGPAQKREWIEFRKMCLARRKGELSQIELANAAK